MTIICIKNGIVAADTGGFQSTVITTLTAEKIVRSADGAIGGSCGETSATSAFRSWFSLSTPDIRHNSNPVHPLKFEKDTDFDSMWLEPNGEIWRMDWAGRPWKFSDNFAAIGAPYEMALGAMLAGASAAEAVRICIERHAYAAGDVVTESTKPLNHPSYLWKPEFATHSEVDNVLRGRSML